MTWLRPVTIREGAAAARVLEVSLRWCRTGRVVWPKKPRKGSHEPAVTYTWGVDGSAHARPCRLTLTAGGQLRREELQGSSSSAGVVVRQRKSSSR